MRHTKDFKIWGVSYGLVGDLIMGLPVLRYFEHKYPNSYKIWVIEKKVAFMAPFFLNHPLIDRIHITEEWAGFGGKDYELADSCDVKCVMGEWRHDPVDWYNYRDCIDETARLSGVMDMQLTPYEKYPRLERWFDVGEDLNLSTYSKENYSKEDTENTIAIFPFATAGRDNGRSPSVEWWLRMVAEMQKAGYRVYQFGMPDDSLLSSNLRYNHLTFFEQVKIALSCTMSIGTDSGNMWVMGAYSHPAIHLMTNWLPNHNSNKFALSPVNINGVNLFAYNGTSNISHENVIEAIRGIMK